MAPSAGGALGHLPYRTQALERRAELRARQPGEHTVDDRARGAGYLNADEAAQSSTVAAAFGPNGKRLREVRKQRYDPDNVFHLNQNIKP